MLAPALMWLTEQQTASALQQVYDKQVESPSRTIAVEHDSLELRGAPTASCSGCCHAAGSTPRDPPRLQHAQSSPHGQVPGAASGLLYPQEGSKTPASGTRISSGLRQWAHLSSSRREVQRSLGHQLGRQQPGRMRAVSCVSWQTQALQTKLESAPGSRAPRAAQRKLGHQESCLDVEAKW